MTTATLVTYTTVAPAATLVRLRLFSDATYTNPPVYDSNAGNPPIQQAGGAWQVTISLPDGTYFSSATVDDGDGAYEDRSADDVVVVAAGSSQSVHSPCPWPWAPLAWPTGFTDAALLARVKAIAQEVLWRASGRRFGVCSMTIRPAGPSCQKSTYMSSGLYGGLNPALIGGVWRNCGGCGCGAVCDCGGAGNAQVRLPAPVQSVQSVIVNNVALPATAYRVDDHQWLVRQDGGVWPSCQDMALPSGAAGTFQVTLTYGIPLGAQGIYAYGLYAEQLYKLGQGGACQLPANVEGIFRQGINIDLSDDNLDALSRGRTGIPQVDAWLGLVNPFGIHEPSKVFSPDVPKGRVRTS